jgi:hypothetical protein
MADWTLQTLRDLDLRYAEKGVTPHQRPLLAAKDILGTEFVLGVGGNPEVNQITEAYEAMVPQVNDTWPGMGTGLAAVVDQVRRVTVPVVFGTCHLTSWKALGFANEKDWWLWCREDRELAARAEYAVADLFDLTYGLDELTKSNAANELWHMARSNLSDCANTLPGTFSVDSVLQPICLTAELAMKASLVQAGADPGAFGKKGGEGHDLVRLAARLASARPHRDDPVVAAIAAAMPAYVASRYVSAGLTRLRVVRLALGAQLVAAASVRRWSARDLAGELEIGSWPGPRPALFI